MPGPSENGSIELALAVEIVPGLIVASLSYGSFVEARNGADLDEKGEFNVFQIYHLLLRDGHGWFDILDAQMNKLEAKDGDAEEVHNSPSPSCLYIYLPPWTLHI